MFEEALQGGRRLAYPAAFTGVSCETPGASFPEAELKELSTSSTRYRNEPAPFAAEYACSLPSVKAGEPLKKLPRHSYAAEISPTLSIPPGQALDLPGGIVIAPYRSA